MPGFSPAPPPGSGVWWKVTKSAEIWVVTKNCDLKTENICENSSKVQESWLTCAHGACACVPPPSRISELSFALKRTSTWLRMNSTTTDWIRTSMKAAVPLKQADSICFDLRELQAEVTRGVGGGKV